MAYNNKFYQMARDCGLSESEQENVINSLSEKEKIALLSSDFESIAQSYYHLVKTEEGLKKKKDFFKLAMKHTGFPVDEVIPLPSGKGMVFSDKVKTFSNEITVFRTSKCPSRDLEEFHKDLQLHYQEQVEKVEVRYSSLSPAFQALAWDLGLVVEKPTLAVKFVGRKH